MCTLTWWAGDSGYEVFFNRDEKKDRPVASPPALSEKGGVRFLAPRDPAAGGTWILVSEFGVTFTLLNWYSRETVSQSGRKSQSRGRLVLEIGDVKDSEQLKTRLDSFDPSLFQPFRLLAFFPGEAELKIDYWQWSGAGSFQPMPCPPMPVCSSSFDRGTVIEKREVAHSAAMDEGAGPEHLWRYHHNSGSSEVSAYTVRMNRPDAQTWSISRVAVEPEGVRFLYEAEAPNLASEPEHFEVLLDRKV